LPRYGGNCPSPTKWGITYEKNKLSTWECIDNAEIIINMGSPSTFLLINPPSNLPPSPLLKNIYILEKEKVFGNPS
jgi:hypothetical protein